MAGLDGGVGGCVGRDITGVEGTERKLGTRLTDGLCGNDADGLAELHHLGSGEVAAVALLTYAVAALACEDRTYLDSLDGRVLYLGHYGLCDFLTCGQDKLAGGGMDDVVY